MSINTGQVVVVLEETTGTTISLNGMSFKEGSNLIEKFVNNESTYVNKEGTAPPLEVATIDDPLVNSNRQVFNHIFLILGRFCENNDVVTYENYFGTSLDDVTLTLSKDVDGNISRFINGDTYDTFYQRT